MQNVIKKNALFFVAIFFAAVAVPLQAIGAKKDGDYAEFKKALENLNTPYVEQIIAQQKNDGAKRNLVTTSNRGRKPIDIVAQAYINLDKGPLKEKAQGNTGKIIIALVRNGANILDLEEYGPQDPFLKQVYDIYDTTNKEFAAALQAVDAETIKAHIDYDEQADKNSDILKTLVTKKTKSGDTPLQAVAKAYIQKVKDNPAEAEAATKNIKQILSLLVDHKANLLDLKPYAKVGSKNYNSVIADFYNRRTVSTKK